MTKDETLRLALEALEEIGLKWTNVLKAIDAIKEQLETKDEPVAVKLMTERIITDNNGRKHITTEPLPHQSEQGDKND